MLREDFQAPETHLKLLEIVPSTKVNGIVYYSWRRLIMADTDTTQNIFTVSMIMNDSELGIA